MRSLAYAHADHIVMPFPSTLTQWQSILSGRQLSLCNCPCTAATALVGGSFIKLQLPSAWIPACAQWLSIWMHPGH